MVKIDYGYSRAERVVRRFTVILRINLPDSQYYWFTSILKRFRFFTSKRDLQDLLLESPKYFTSRPVELQNLTVCITHDIDSADCAKYLKGILLINNQFGVLPTINFLTSGSYKLTPRLLDLVVEFNGEIGLHGDYHDLYFCCREKSQIAIRLNEMLRSFPTELTPKSFRHPGFGMSEDLASVLADFGFTRDASLKSGALLGEPGDYPSPKFLPLTSILEVRTSISDDAMVREFGLTDSQQLNLITKVATEVASNNGVLNMNFHPGIVGKNFASYENLLKTLTSQFNTTFQTLQGVTSDEGN